MMKIYRIAFPLSQKTEKKIALIAADVFAVKDTPLLMRVFLTAWIADGTHFKIHVGQMTFSTNHQKGKKV